MRNFDANELERRVDEVLFYKWDPIGVSDTPCARGEYKSYVAGVLSILVANEKVNPIADHLGNIERNRMGEVPDMQRLAKVAELLLEHKRAISAGLA
jgi:hypothetical protein